MLESYAGKNDEVLLAALEGVNWRNRHNKDYPMPFSPQNKERRQSTIRDNMKNMLVLNERINSGQG